jgi:hypothetical protein
MAQKIDEWFIDVGVSDSVEEAKSRCLFLSYESTKEFEPEKCELYTKYGFSINEKDKTLSLDLDEILIETQHSQRLEDEVEALIKIIGMMRQQMEKRDVEVIEKLKSLENGEK